MANTTKKPVAVIGTVGIILGFLFALVGVGAWTYTSLELNSQQITVPGDANFLAGARVNNPFAALAQADVIGMHQQNGAVSTLEANQSVLQAAGIDFDADATYNFATLGPVNNQLNAAVEAGTITADDAAPILALRNTANQASTLQASLFTSVLAFGVSLFAFAVGVFTILAGVALRKLAADDSSAVPAPAQN